MILGCNNPSTILYEAFRSVPLAGSFLLVRSYLQQQHIPSASQREHESYIIRIVTVAHLR